MNKHADCVPKLMLLYNKTHSIRQNFDTLPECFNYYHTLHKEYLLLLDNVRSTYFKKSKEDGKFFAEKCLTFYTIHFDKDEMDVSYADLYLFWNCIPFECDCIKLCLLLIPIILFQKVLFYKITDADKKFNSFVKFRDILKDIYEVVLKGEKKIDTTCPYMNTLLSNTLTKLKRLETTIQSVIEEKIKQKSNK